MRRSILLAVFAIVTAAGAAQAQVLGTLQGYITDEQGALLPGATVVIRNSETGSTREVVTNAEGFYTSPSLQPSVYSITASLQGMQPTTRESVRLLVGQVLDVGLQLRLGSVTEEVTVTAETPIVEVSRSSTVKYVSEEEIENLPIAGRNFTDFALLQPTVKTDTVRGGISLSGQKGVSSGLNIDGTEAKSAFFGYGRGGEATENDGLVIAQDSVKEFQVVVNGFAPEYGRSGGGYLNVVTKSGTNELRGTAFGFLRNDGLASDLKPTGLDVFNGNTDTIPISEFQRKTWGASLGGPIVKDRTHFFVSYDQVDRTDPFTRTINGRGQYDAVLQRFPGLLDGFTPNSDGIAAADPDLGRTARGNFVRGIDNVILFGKITHQIDDRNTLSIRYNYTDYERASDFKGEESLKTQQTHSIVAQLVSVFGSNVVNEFRFQWAKDKLDRLSNLAPDDIVANFRIFSPSFGSFGKPDFLPIFVREDKLQFQNNLSVSAGNHDVKFGADINIDDLSEFFAGSYDGRYNFNNIDDFLANQDSGVRIWLADISPPPDVNFEVTQQTVGLYAQDTWRPSREVTLNYGLRWEGTFNPDGLEHALPEGREIPDDLNNFAPRVGVTYTPGGEGSQVFRAGFGRFFDRTPTLIFFDVIQGNGIPPNFGRITARPGQPGHVPLGTPIDHAVVPPGLVPATSIFDPGFEDAATWRANLGYERELAPSWAAALDLSWAKNDNLQSSYDSNVFPAGRDEFGRPVYPDGRPDASFQAISIRNDISRSQYLSATIGVTKRFSEGYQLQAHYTVSQDMDNDSNERSATSITLTDFNEPDYDWGSSDRDIRHRFVFSGLVELPLEFKLSAIGTIQSGPVYTAFDPDDNITNNPTSRISARAIVNGQVSERNAFHGPTLSNVNVRLVKYFSLGPTAQLELIAEGFNLFNKGNFTVSSSDFYENDGVTLRPEFGIAGRRAEGPTFGLQRQFQLGARIRF